MSSYFVAAINLFNVMSVFAARVVLALYALELGAQALTVGILAAVFSAFPLVLSVPAGKLADRFGPRWVLIPAALVGAVGMLIPYFVSGLPAIFMAAALIGLSGGVYNVMLQNLIGLLSNPDNRLRNFNNFTMIASVGISIAPLIGGFSIDYSNHATACLYIAVLTLLPAVMLALQRGVLPAATRQLAPVAGGVRAMLTAPGVPRLLAIGGLLVVGQDVYQIYMPVYTHAIGMSASTIGIVLSTNAVATVIVRLILPRLVARFDEEKVLAYSFYAGAISLVLIPFFKDAGMLALMSVIFGLGMGCCGPISMSLMFSSSAEGRSGEALGLRMAVIHFAKLVGPVAFGVIASAFGMFPIFWINALMMGGGGVLSRTKKRA